MKYLKDKQSENKSQVKISTLYTERLEAINKDLLQACIWLIEILTFEQYNKQFPNVYKFAKQAIKQAEEK